MSPSALTLLRTAVVTVVSAAFAVGCAVAVVRLAVRTRFFSTDDRLPDTWHGRPIREADHEPQEGLNPFILAFLTFWVAFTVALTVLDGPMPA
ncbi:hypothetical protein C475_12482 [Halosimplex carlsbadense 2-9-1]|uniref:Uncharacterized protein n=1 Tax=Halosimplex carlsbadense 2-9-1 TaxID=797114 RepID=M0CPU1_9EURY|nr:hypothetical protein [Halosimplex carlsbadense]ELZ24407.1 hypothetical protein C475_12482 [Halosimplex carlsbadense 2-9-1]